MPDQLLYVLSVLVGCYLLFRAASQELESPRVSSRIHRDCCLSVGRPQCCYMLMMCALSCLVTGAELFRAPGWREGRAFIA
jgi:hypothetical protein